MNRWFRISKQRKEAVKPRFGDLNCPLGENTWNLATWKPLKNEQFFAGKLYRLHSAESIGAGGIEAIYRRVY